MPGTIEKSPTEKSALRGEVLHQVAALVTIAFGLVAALAWNTAIQEAFRVYFGDATGLAPMLTYALIVTVVAVLATIWIGRVAGKMGVQQKGGAA